MNEYCNEHKNCKEKVDRMDKDIYGEDAQTPSIFETIREIKKQLNNIYKIPSFLIILLTVLKIGELIYNYIIKK